MRLAIPTRGFSRKQFFLLWAMFAVALTVVYFPALRGGLVWDDNEHVTSPELQSVGGLFRIWADLGATQQYYPLLHSAFWIEHRLWGDVVLGYHLVNILLHAANACLLALVILRLLAPRPSSVWAALLGAAIFAFHPVNVESVAWISEQKNTLSTAFYLWSALLYLEFDETRDRRANLFASILFICALLTKSVTATLPAALLVVLWWKRGRLTRNDFAPLVPWLVVGAFMGLFTAWVERRYVGAMGADFNLGSIERLLLAARIICFYLGKFIWPAGLVFVYPRWRIDGSEPSQWIYLLILFVLAIALFLYRRRSRAPLAAFLFFAGSLFPTLGFFDVFPFRYSFVADHWLYLPSIGLTVLAAAAFAGLVGHGPSVFGPRSAAIAASVAITLIFAALAFRQARNYGDIETFYRAILSRNGDAWLAQFNLGTYLTEKGEMPEAIGLIERAAKLRPDDPQIHGGLGVAYAQAKRDEDALLEFATAIKLQPEDFSTNVNLGNLLFLHSMFPQAAERYQVALKSHPDDPNVHNGLARALFAAGRYAEALAEFEATMAKGIDTADVHMNAGACLYNLRRFDAAIAHFQDALKLEPGSADVRARLDAAQKAAAGQ